MRDRTGIQFEPDGVAERALLALAATPRPTLHHNILAVHDLERALRLLPIRQAVLRDAEQDAALSEEPTKVGPNLELARLNMELAEAAVKVCLSRLDVRLDAQNRIMPPGPGKLPPLKARINPLSGKAINTAPGRAPHWLPGVTGQLEAEAHARHRARSMRAQLKALPEGAKLPEISDHETWHRLTFRQYIETPAHDDDRARAMAGVDVGLVPIEVLAFSLYVYRSLSQSAIPITTRIEGWRLIAHHAIWRDRLPPRDLDLIAECVADAARRLHLHVERRADGFHLLKRLNSVMDYAHICRHLREKNPRHPSADDAHMLEDMPPPALLSPGFKDAAHPGMTRHFGEWLHDDWIERDRAALTVTTNATAKPWTDPRPHLKDAALKWSVKRLFDLVENFDMRPPADLSKRTPGPAWYTATGTFRVSRQLIAAELADAVIGGDLECCLWWQHHCFPAIADDVLDEAVAIAADIIRATAGLS